jgi:hypothetical protein
MKLIWNTLLHALDAIMLLLSVVFGLALFVTFLIKASLIEPSIVPVSWRGIRVTNASSLETWTVLREVGCIFVGSLVYFTIRLKEARKRQDGEVKPQE